MASLQVDGFRECILRAKSFTVGGAHVAFGAEKQFDYPNAMNITMPHTCRMASLCAVLTSPEFRAPWSSEGGGRAG